MIPHNRPSLDASDIQSVSRVLKSGWIAEGRVTRRFETKLAAYLKRRYAKAVSSGTAALHLALLALGIKKGDEVICSTYACTALLNAIYYTGARPRLCDIDPKSLGPCPISIRKLLNRRTKAIIVNHAFGFSAPIKKIMSFGVPVIEDIAQALGSQAHGRPLGSFGDLTVCSFYATKVIATGYGGMALTSNKKWANKINDLTHYDQRPDYKVRYNYSLSDINSALGLSQLAKLDRFVRRRRQIARQYLRILKRKVGFKYWQGQAGEQPNFYRFLVRTRIPFVRVNRHFKRRGIQVIEPLTSRQLLHRYLRLPRNEFPAAEAYAGTVFSLPIFPALQSAEVQRICDSLNALPA